MSVRTASYLGQWIAIDWGTTNFRAWWVTAQGEVLDSIDKGQGMASLARDQFADYCARQIAPWRAQAEVPIYMAGMVGADQGWQLAPQLPVPLTLAELAKRVIPAPGLVNAWIVPGAQVVGKAADVMRGEEVQIFGALALLGRDSGLCCLPGTHSKWAEVEARTLLDFSTVMTGEIYSLLLAHSILARSLPKEGHTSTFNIAAFDRGLAKAAESQGLLNQLFSTRSLFLQGSLLAGEVADYVSGMLIGHEVMAMSHLYPVQDDTLVVVGRVDLQARYERALSQAGYVAEWVDARAASLAGMRQIVHYHAAAGG